MEEYLQYMKTLRSQMNDMEDQAAKLSVEEQTQLTTIHTLESDLTAAKSETAKLKEEIERMMKGKGQICSEILEKQRKITSLETDSSTLAQVASHTYYMTVAEDLNVRLQQQQDWINSHKASNELGSQGMVKDTLVEQTGETGGNVSLDNHLVLKNLNDPRKDLMAKVDSAKAKLDEISEMKSKLVMENRKMKQVIEQAKCRENGFKPELRAMDIKTLEEEYDAISSDNAGETDYFHSLKGQVEKLKEISHVVKCACGEEYRVGVDLCAQENETRA
ncbi:hypothetical protein FNV43_RR19242 [Rhamnella rubrinervis]|uniref:Uncharacterized protein n=1 Tax=Rhamnella rubrinervis TaxID=2594499 RepID=A0A8K0E674_9ROSA|nr:hypothetical protein FNV43_RR19242 [Rhamnella rubrinervis]